jgi:NADH dehydrogenase (ubiquinone) Fe-S protein 1
VAHFEHTHTPGFLQVAVASLGDARDDWKIVRALSEVVGAPLPYNSLDDVRRRLADVAPHLARRDALEPPLWLNGEYFKVCACGVRRAACPARPDGSSRARSWRGTAGAGARVRSPG